MKRPNIVLFLAEDLDYEGLNCYDAVATGYTGLIHAGNSYAGETEVPTQEMLTPTIDTMAGNGAMFESYYCASPICTPARYSVLTGRFPERSPELIQEAGGKPATIWFNTPIMPGETLLPKQLKQSGYHTAIFGKWHNYPTEVYNQIYDQYTSFPDTATWDDPEAQKAVRRGYQMAADYLRGETFGWDVAERIYYENPEIIYPYELSCQNIDWVVEGAVSFIREQREEEQPFFAYVAVSLPHSRYNGERFSNANLRSSPAGLLEDIPSVMSTREEIRARVKAAGLPDDACEGLWLDEAVKAIHKAVCEIGKEQETCFIFTTDHPTAGKGSCHLGRIPLIFYWPGTIEALPPQRQLLSEVDLTPTILEMAGCPLAPDTVLDGRSFWNLLRRQPFRERESVMMEVVNSRAIVKDGFKYIANRLPGRSIEEVNLFLARELHSANRFSHPPMDEETAWKTVGWFAIPERDYMFWNLDRLFPDYFDKDQLYDLRSDPLEQHNLAEKPHYKAILKEMQEEMKRQLANMPNPFSV